MMSGTVHWESSDGATKRTGTVSEMGDLLESQNGVLSVLADAPPGIFRVEWEAPLAESAPAYFVSAELSKNNLNQNCGLETAVGDGDWEPAGGNGKDWTWEKCDSLVWAGGEEETRIRVAWVFNKPGVGPNWQVRLKGLEFRKLDEAQALKMWQTPLATGLPPLANPTARKKKWTSQLTIRDGVLRKDGEPFFPIGFVFGTSEKELAQAVAMGCNAIHFEVGWHVANRAGEVPTDVFDPVLSAVDRAAEWGIASFPLLTGHYVPEWFSGRYGSSPPIGSDGEPTGSWFPYSIHFPPLRKHLPDFWKTAALEFGKKPSVACVNFWNEPCYGGTWNRGDQFGDYSSDGIADYRADLRSRYSTIAELNDAFGTTCKSFEEFAPPRSASEMGATAWLDWMEYGQRAFAGFFDWEREILRSASPDLRLANKKQTNPLDRSAASSGTNWSLLSNSEDLFGINAYAGSPMGYRDIFDMARSYAGRKPVIVFETNVMPPNAAGRTPDAIRCQLWAQIVGGARGMFIFAMMGGNSEHGLLDSAAVSDEGRKEYARFTKTVSENQLPLASPTVPAKIAVLYSTTAVLLNPGDSIPKYTMGAFDLFRNSHFQVDILPEEDLSAEKLSQYSLIVLPTGSILKQAGLEQLAGFFDRGGKLLAFSGALARNKNLQPLPLPKFLGIESRQAALGGRENLRLGAMDNQLKPYVDGEATISGVELISKVSTDSHELVPGKAIESSQPGRVLASNSDSYPSVVSSDGETAVYCAFESNYSEAIRGLIEGITREVFGIKQSARLTGDGVTEADILVGQRVDVDNPGRRFLVAINCRYRETKVQIETAWDVSGEKLHNITSDEAGEYVLGPREVYLFELNEKND